MPVEMTDDDMRAAPAIADKVIAVVCVAGPGPEATRPPAAVAGVAMALAAVAHLAECGPEAARKLFDHFYTLIDKATDPPRIVWDRDPS